MESFQTQVLFGSCSWDVWDRYQCISALHTMRYCPLPNEILLQQFWGIQPLFDSFDTNIGISESEKDVSRINTQMRRCQRVLFKRSHQNSGKTKWIQRVENGYSELWIWTKKDAYPFSRKTRSNGFHNFRFCNDVIKQVRLGYPCGFGDQLYVFFLFPSDPAEDRFLQIRVQNTMAQISPKKSLKKSKQCFRSIFMLCFEKYVRILDKKNQSEFWCIQSSAF